MVVIGELVPSTGAAVLALAPAPLIADRLAVVAGARRESAAALAVGTLAVSLVLLPAAAPRGVAGYGSAVLALALGLALAAMPTIRDLVLPVLVAARYVAVGLVLVLLGVAVADRVDATAVAFAFALLAVGALSAAFAARLLGGNPLAAAIGGGTRDPAVAGALLLGGGADASAVPLAYAALLAGAVLAAGVLRKLVIRDDARREAAGEQRRR